MGAELTASPVYGVVTDSSSQITDELVDRFGIEVVPLVVTIDGIDHLERDELDADGFYAHYAGGHVPEVATREPSTGAFAAAYARLVARGCTAIVSVHLAAALSGTVGAARRAARDAGVPVHVVDTRSASFGVSACAWAAAVALRRGGSADDVHRRIEGLVARMGSAFLAGVSHLDERTGRPADASDDGVQVLALEGGHVRLLDRVTTVEDAVDVLSTFARSWVEREPRGVTVAIGTADAPGHRLAVRLDDALRDLPGIDDVIHYRIGPSVGAHTGPDTSGLFVFPTIR